MTVKTEDVEVDLYGITVRLQYYLAIITDNIAFVKVYADKCAELKTSNMNRNIKK